MINNKHLIKAFIGFTSAIALGWMALLIKLLTLGSETWQGNVNVFFIPVGRIENSADSFSIESNLGILFLGIIGGIIGFLVARKSKQNHQN